MTSTDIANMALGHLGTSRIADFAENSPAAENIRRFWDATRRTLLREFDWNFAITRASLTALATPVTGFAYAYQLPADCLRLLTVNGKEAGTGQARFEVESGKLLSNETPAAIRYIRDVETATDWDDTFAVAFSYRLAAAIAPSLSAQPSLAEAMLARAEDALNKAKGVDSVETRPRVIRGVEYSGYYAARTR